MKKSHIAILASAIAVILIAAIIIFNNTDQDSTIGQGNTELSDSTINNSATSESSLDSGSKTSDMPLSVNIDSVKEQNNSSTVSNEVNTTNESIPTYSWNDSLSWPSDSAATITPSNESAKIANRGIVIVGSAPYTRALEPHSGSASLCNGYAQTANEIKKALGSGVNVYCMIIPTAVEFYCPASVKNRMSSQRATFEEAYRHLNGVRAVNIYNSLSNHVGEDIYLRTDHHWSPLGGYSAAQELARVAGVPFRDLSNYDRHVVKGYVGSMYSYSKDISIKQSPEDFVYYTPRNVEYTTTYVNYKSGAKAGVKGNYFYSYPDGSGGAYCTFMGGDSKITQVRTGNHNGRRIAILKDSFGNTIPGYLFYSFEEIHVIDYRYFNRNLKEYVADNNITDLCIANNIKATLSAAKSYRKFIK